MAQINNTTAAVTIPESWAKDVELTRDEKLVMASRVERKFESDLVKGDQVHIPFMGDLTTESIVSGTDMTPVANTETEVVLTVDTFEGVTVELFDKTRWQSAYELPTVYKDRIGQALAEKMDTDLHAEYANVAAAHIQPTVAGLTYAGVVDAFSLLDEDNVPQSDRSLVVNAVSMGDLRQLAEFTRYDATGQNNPSVDPNKNMVGLIYGVPVFMSNQVATNVNYQNLLFHRSAFALAAQKEVDLEQHRNPLGSAEYLIGRTLYGTKTIRDDHAVVLQRTP